MKILVCGDRNWTNASSIAKQLNRFVNRHATYQDVTVIHGAARGADSLAASAAKHLGLLVESHPANWSRYGRAAGPIRNQEMLDQKPDLVIAFHPDLSKSKGTADMVRRAKAAGIPVEVYSD